MTSSSLTAALARPSRLRLWVEFSVLFLGAPLFLALAAKPDWAFPLLGATTVLGVVLLAFTPRFRWRSLIEGPIGPHWRLTLVFSAVSAAIIWALTLWLRPEWLFYLPLEVTGLWLMIMALYPIVSVLPQELLYRSLFFERYGALFGAPTVQIAVNAALFGLAHAFYANWPAVLLTTAGGALFATAYLVHRSFPLAMLWHTIAGQLIFTIGLGRFFYHGAV